MKPEMLGGGSRSFSGVTFDDFAFPAAGISADGLSAQNENGFYTISGAAVGSNAQQFTLTVCAASNDDYVPGAVDPATGVLTVGQCGTPVRTSTVEPNTYSPLAEAAP